MGAYDLGELGPAQVVSSGLQGLLEAYKMKLGAAQEEAKLRTSERNAAATAGLGWGRLAETTSHNTEMERLRELLQNKPPKTKSVGQEAIDRKFGNEYAGFIAGGGYSDVEKQLSALDRSADYLESPAGADASGPWVGKIPDKLRSFTKAGQGAISAREGVEETVQRNLRGILGPQFTEREGEKLIARAYNPQLLPAENARRTRLLKKQINEAAQAKVAAGEYMEKNGTLSGFPGVLRSSANDFLTDADLGAPPPPAASGGKYAHLTDEQLKAMGQGQ